MNICLFPRRHRRRRHRSGLALRRDLIAPPRHDICRKKKLQAMMMVMT